MAFPLIALGAIAAGGALLGGASAAEKSGRIPHKFGDYTQTDRFDPNATKWGGYQQGLQHYTANMYNRGMDASERGANLANYDAANTWEGKSAEARETSRNTADMMYARAAGQTPSIAGMQANEQMRQLGQQSQQAAQQAQAAQAAQAASARGAAGVALAGQGAAANVANAQSAIGAQQAMAAQGISNQAQINAAAERAQAEQAAYGAYSNLRQGDQASQAQSVGQSQFQAGMAQANRNANDQKQMGYEQLGFNAQQSSQQAATQHDATLASAHAAADANNYKRAEHNADKDTGLFGGMLGGIGKVFSDTRAKESATLEKGRQQGLALARGGAALTRGPTGPDMGDPNAPQVQFDPVRGWTRPGDQSYAEDTIGKADLDQQMNRQVAQDRDDMAIDAALANQADDDVRRARDPAVGLGRAPKGYAAMRADQPGGINDPERSNVRDAAKYADLAPGTEDFDRTSPSKEGPWWMTPVSMGGGMLSDDRAKLAAAWEAGRNAGQAGFETQQEAREAEPMYGQVAPPGPSPLPPPKENPERRPRRSSAYNFADAKRDRSGESRLSEGRPAKGERRMESFERGSPVELARGGRNTREAATDELLRGTTRGVVRYDKPEIASDEFRYAESPEGKLGMMHPDTPGGTTAPNASNPLRYYYDRFLSDERTKALRPERGPVADANRSMRGSAYAYKEDFTPPDQAPGEPNFGPMAQNMERSKVAGTAVKVDPQTSLRTIDRDKALKVAMSGIADLQRQQDELRVALAKGGRKRRVA